MDTCHLHVHFATFLTIQAIISSWQHLLFFPFSCLSHYVHQTDSFSSSSSFYPPSFSLFSLVQSIVSYFPHFQSERSLVVHLLGFHLFQVFWSCGSLRSREPSNKLSDMSLAVFKDSHRSISLSLSVLFSFFLYYSRYFVALSVKSSVGIVTRYPFCCAVCTNICPRCTDTDTEVKRQNHKQLLTIRTNKVF